MSDTEKAAWERYVQERGGRPFQGDEYEEFAFGKGFEAGRLAALEEAAQMVHDFGAIQAGPEGAYYARIIESRIRALRSSSPEGSGQ